MFEVLADDLRCSVEVVDTAVDDQRAAALWFSGYYVVASTSSAEEAEEIASRHHDWQMQKWAEWH